MSLKKARSTAAFSEENKYHKPSYRQKGAELRGSLFRGSTSNAFTKKTIGSIPSKFETVLYPQNGGTRKGFGSNGFRFVAQVSENPGPGAYIDPMGLSVNNFRQTSDSYSRKGFGNGFVSKSDRFRIENYQPYQVPGPGAYKYRETSADGTRKPVGTAFDPGSISEKYKGHASAVFSNPVGKRRVNTQPFLLGPGSYEIPRTLVDQQEYRCTAAFKSKDNRFVRGANRQLLPGPGQYETDMEGIRREILPAASEAASADFKGPSGSKRVKVNLYDPFENVESEEKRTPGPGHYTADQFTIVHKTAEKGNVASSSMFAAHDILDRFGKPKVEVKSALEKVTPGPGQYFGPAGERRTEERTAKSATSAPFKSDTKKGAYLDRKKGPGPAFYKVRSEVIRESKNINPAREWI